MACIVVKGSRLVCRGSHHDSSTGEVYKTQLRHNILDKLLGCLQIKRNILEASSNALVTNCPWVSIKKYSPPTMFVLGGKSGLE